MAAIGTFDKRLETRSKNMLGRLVGQRIILAETKQGGSLAMYSAVLLPGHAVRSQRDGFRGQHTVNIEYDGANFL